MTQWQITKRDVSDAFSIFDIDGTYDIFTAKLMWPLQIHTIPPLMDDIGQMSIHEYDRVMSKAMAVIDERLCDDAVPWNDVIFDTIIFGSVILSCGYTPAMETFKFGRDNAVAQWLPPILARIANMKSHKRNLATVFRFIKNATQHIYEYEYYVKFANAPKCHERTICGLIFQDATDFGPNFLCRGANTPCVVLDKRKLADKDTYDNVLRSAHVMEYVYKIIASVIQ